MADEKERCRTLKALIAVNLLYASLFLYNDPRRCLSCSQEAVKDEVQRLTPRNDLLTIAIQIRVGDWVLDPNVDDTQAITDLNGVQFYFDCAKQIQETRQTEPPQEVGVCMLTMV